MNMAQEFAQSGSGDLNNASSLASMVAAKAMDLQNYEAGGVNNTYTGTTGLAADSSTPIRSAPAHFGAAERDQYMSPYMSAVTESAQADAARRRRWKSRR